MKWKSALVTDLSGSMGGLTASHNRGGRYFRERIVPTDPMTPRQVTMRSVMADLVTHWTSQLTQAERDAWENYAENTPQTDQMGQVNYLTGQQAFIKANAAKVNSNLRLGTTFPIVEAAPTVYTAGPAGTILSYSQDVSGAPTEYEVVWSSQSPTPGAGDIFLYRGRLVNSSRNYYDGPWRLAATSSFNAAATGGTITVTTPDGAGNIPYPVTGQPINLKATMVYDDGRVSHSEVGRTPALLTV